MKAVKLKIDNLPFDGVQLPAGVVVKVPDSRATELIRLGHAEAAADDAEVANPDHNPLADVIDPSPPGGVLHNPFAAPEPPKAPAAIKVPKVKTEEVK